MKLGPRRWRWVSSYENRRAWKRKKSNLNFITIFFVGNVFATIYLEHLVRACLDPWDEVVRPEGGLLDLGEVVPRVLVQDHLANLYETFQNYIQ